MRTNKHKYILFVIFTTAITELDIPIYQNFPEHSIYCTWGLKEQLPPLTSANPRGSIHIGRPNLSCPYKPPG